MAERSPLSPTARRAFRRAVAMWFQFFLVANSGLFGGILAAVAMRYALGWADATDLRPIRQAANPRRAKSAGREKEEAATEAPAPTLGFGFGAKSADSADVPVETPVDVPMPQAPPPDLDLPEEWLETLAAQNIAPHSCYEAVIHVLRLEVGTYREALCTLEERLRTTRAGDAAKLRSTLDDAESLVRIWHERQQAALTILKNDPTFDPESVKHGAVLRMLQFQHDRHSDLLAQLAPAGRRRDGAELREQGAESVRECLEMVHRLRDWVMGALAELLRTQGRLADLPERATFDGTTSILNRVGLERSFTEWQSVNPTGDRPASAAIVHIDDFHRVNARLGTRGAEVALRAFAELSRSLLRRNRGFDVVARAGGVDLIVLMGDTPSRQAVAVVERLRQTIEESEFIAGSLTFGMTLTACVADCDSLSPIGDQVERLSRNVRAAATRFGRNRTFVEGDRGAEPVDAPPMVIKPKSVTLGAEIEVRDKGVDVA